MMIFKKIFFCTFLSLFLFHKIKSQSFNFKNYTVEDGLPYIQIYNIFQDDKGYLWTGGYGGLSSFNGINFSNYGPRKGLVHYWVKSITQDSSKNLIIGTLNGLSVFNGKKFTNYTTQDGLPDNYINSIDAKGAETAIATRDGLCYLYHQKIKNDTRFKNVDVTKVKSTYKDYVISTIKKIVIVAKDKVQTVCEFLPNSDTVITFFETDKNATLWIGTNKGLYYINNYDLQNNIKQAIPTSVKNNITCLYADEKNVLWIGTNTGLIKYFNGLATTYQISKETAANNISCITVDYEQNVWIGTNNGLIKFRDEGFVYYNANDGLNNSFIQTIVTDKKNKLWFATAGGGIYKYDNKQFRSFSTKNNLEDNYTAALAVDSLNRLWMATDKGLSYELNDKIISTNFLANNLIHFLFLDKQSNLWAGLNNQVVCIENIYAYPNSKIKTYNLPLPKNAAGFQLSSMCEDGKGNLYIASFLGGLFMYDGKTITDITSTFNLPTRAVLDVKVSSTNYLYVATLDGVY
ncbi:MAG: two-component regulator propeller domain-containing protein, partial [Bacteroidia bacterium]